MKTMNTQKIQYGDERDEDNDGGSDGNYKIIFSQQYWSGQDDENDDSSNSGCGDNDMDGDGGGDDEDDMG